MAVTEYKGLQYYTEDSCFSKQEMYENLKESGYQKTESSFLVAFQQLLNDGYVQRIGRNRYRVANRRLTQYQHEYSEHAKEVAGCIREKHPYLDFVIFETVQLNEFLNHQIGQNTLFVFTDADAMDFVFRTLLEAYPGKVLLDPSEKEFYQYRTRNTIVIRRLISEAPKDGWHETIEKMLVDIMTEPLIRGSFSESEYPAIYEGAFERYLIDESRMLRYAGRRNAKEKLKTYLEENTDIELMQEGGRN